ncbi:restriction endonuclease subunit S [Sphingobium sp. B8D3D]|uniref:restriction endonuclease subunit S n=1 Tax=Sphingobium sp. B8D3D TaxID=2940587 RepID=UPI00222524B2|nr:restriction endonuclease subunit S [Sphingobium sp. B8D3D]MCW2413900.1 type I restriction enzyme S subunit [Sphingobium sp. B8D3A]
MTDGTHYTPADAGEGVPFLTVADMHPAGLNFISCSRISEHDFAEADRQNSAPKRGDVLFSKDGTVGKVHVVKDEEPFAVLSSIAIIRPDSQRLDANYLAHFLRSPAATSATERSKTGSALRRIILKDIRRLRLDPPPLPEQRRIAAILDQADALRRLRRQSLSRLSDLRRAAFDAAFKNQARLETVPLSNVVAPGTIVTYGIVQAGEEFAGGVPYIRTGDIKDGVIRGEDLRHTDPTIAERFHRSKVRAGEIVMSIRATVGTTAVVPDWLDGANLTQGTARISPGPRTHKRYLLEYLRSERVQRWIQRQVKGATFREITLSRLRELPVEVPTMEAQEEFALSIEALENQEQLFNNSLIRFDSLFASLQHRAFRGEL